MHYMLPVLYEDDDMLAIDKPPGISSIPERDPAVDSVALLLGKKTGRKIFVVHRLDKEVGGAMLFAKTAAAHKYLNGQFFDRAVRKIYLALVHGTVGDTHGSVDKAIRQFGSGRMGVDEKAGKPCRTEYVVLKREGGYTLLHAFPVTGRRHQIRVHLYHIGHPIVGDRMYGEKMLQQRFPRLMLHAKTIAFKKVDGSEMVIESTATELFEKSVSDLMTAGSIMAGPKAGPL